MQSPVSRAFSTLLARARCCCEPGPSASAVLLTAPQNNATAKKKIEIPGHGRGHDPAGGVRRSPSSSLCVWARAGGYASGRVLLLRNPQIFTKCGPIAGKGGSSRRGFAGVGKRPCTCVSSSSWPWACLPPHRPGATSVGPHLRAGNLAGRKATSACLARRQSRCPRLFAGQ